MRYRSVSDGEIGKVLCALIAAGAPEHVVAAVKLYLVRGARTAGGVVDAMWIDQFVSEFRCELREHSHRWAIPLGHDPWGTAARRAAERRREEAALAVLPQAAIELVPDPKYARPAIPSDRRRRRSRAA